MTSGERDDTPGPAPGVPGEQGRPGRPWRSLAERAGEGAPRPALPAPATLDPVSRRGFLNLLGGSLTLAGMTSCTRQPLETILPYARRPEDTLPGEPLYFATVLPFATGALGLLVESHDGRPTKVEGNPDHPASLGSTDVFAQASVLDLYDPDRSEAVTYRAGISTWDAFQTAMTRTLEAVRAKRGAGLRVLSRAVVSPTLAAQRAALLDDLPEARWHVYEPVHRDRERAGALLAFGEDVSVRPRLAAADVVVALDADFLGGEPGNVRLARAFTDRRRVPDGVDARAFDMNRLYAVETRPTITGATADHRIAARPGELEVLVRQLAHLCAVPGARVQPLPEEQAAWIGAVARDLQRHVGSSLVLAGRALSPEGHALVHAINDRLGSAGETLEYGEPVELVALDNGGSLEELVADMRRDAVEVLIVLGGNPVYDAPADLEFADAFERVELRVHLGQQDDETAVRCHWHVPETHFLEAWSDAVAFDGSVSIVQPLIAPLYSGHSAHEVVALLAGQPGKSGYDLVRDHWRTVLGEEGFEQRWRRALHDGVLDGTRRPPRRPSLRAFDPGPAPQAAPEQLELVLYPDDSAWDGRFANNGWLQELPRPLTKLTWDNAALIGPELAERLGVESGDVLALTLGERTTRAAAWVTPGAAEGCVALALGYGRERAGKLGAGAGFDAYPLRELGSPWSASGLVVERTGERYRLATTQSHHSMEGRDIIREVDLPGFRNGATGAPPDHHAPAAESLVPA